MSIHSWRFSTVRNNLLALFAKPAMLGPMIIPLWAVYSLAAAILIATIPLVQEKYKADGAALALWAKVFLTGLVIPFTLHYGMPTDPKFYLYVGITCVIYAVSDVVYYRAVPHIGSGLMTRLLPASVVITFVLWFVADPGSIHAYLANPAKAVAIIAILALFMLCTAKIRKCTISWDGVRMIWPVIAAASIGPVFTKLSFNHADLTVGPYAYILVQSVLMALFFTTYLGIRKPTPRAELFSRRALGAGLWVSVVSMISGLLKFKAIQIVDNPAFVSMVLFTDALWVLLVYRMIGKREKANIVAGLGIVLCAVLVVLVKNWK